MDSETAFVSCSNTLSFFNIDNLNLVGQWMPMYICYQQYLKLPKRKLPLARDSEMMERREIIYMKRINQIRAVCEKYKKMDLNDFKSYFTAILT